MALRGFGRRRGAATIALAALAAAAGCAQPRDDRRAGLALGAGGGAEWRQVTRTLGAGEDPASPNVCDRGEARCLRLVVDEMRRRLRPLVAACDHRAAFALLYLRVTEGVGSRFADRFEDPEYLNHLDAIFAELYFEAYDRYAAGATDRVPAAWRVAFDAALNRRATGLGDMLLGMNAHISRDLPFALVRAGLRTAEGESGRPDYERVDRLLGLVQRDALAEASRLLDPSIDSFELRALNFSSDDVGDLIATWRREAYRNAELLLAARTPAARARVVRRIETNAETRARILLAAMSYALTGRSTVTRDRYCKARRAAG